MHSFIGASNSRPLSTAAFAFTTQRRAVSKTAFGPFAGAEKIAQLSQEEKQIKEENVRLQRKLQMEVERREQLCRHLSESESSLEMDEERIFNEGHCAARSRAVSSPIPYAGPGQR